MAKPRRVPKPVGKGITKKALDNQTDKDFIQVFQITEDAWKAFYQTPAGQKRLNRMKSLNELRKIRYQSIINGGGLPAQTDAQLYSKWRSAN